METKTLTASPGISGIELMVEFISLKIVVPVQESKVLITLLVIYLLAV